MGGCPSVITEESTMTTERRKTLRVAEQVCRAVLRQKAQRSTELTRRAKYLAGSMEGFQKLSRLADKAHRRNWINAAKLMLDRAGIVLDDLGEEVRTMLREQTTAVVQPASGLGDIFRDLEQLDEEFGGWAFDRAKGSLTVLTEPIELEDIPLGPFRIELRLREVGQKESGDVYSIIALEPNPAAGRPDVTHPHVNEKRLCAGDAVNPIRTALESGRLFDFFVLVRSVLQTYNSQSPYVRLEEWDGGGTPCHDCGGTVHEDDSFYCERCDNQFCDACTSFCRTCEESACTECLTRCPVCNDPTCANCLKTCKECEREFCAGCLTDGLCPACNKAKDQTHECDPDPDNPDPIVTQSANLAVRGGEDADDQTEPFTGSTPVEAAMQAT
jgi:hypothetical protein